MSRREDILKRWKVIIALVVSLVVMILFVVSIKEITTINRSVEFFEQEMFEAKMADVKANVRNRLDLIEFVKEQKEEAFLRYVKETSLTVGSLALESVNVLDESASLEEKRSVFIDALHNYNDSQSKYIFFSGDLEGNLYVTNVNRELIGTSVWMLQDSITGRYIIQDFVTLLETDGEGFSEYHYPKVTGGEAILKTSYIKYYPEVELYAGTGLYSDDFIAEAQDEVFASITEYYQNSSSYIYVTSFEGITLAHRNQDLVGTSMLDVKTPDGKPMFYEVLSQLEESDEAIVEYVYAQDGYPGDPVVTKFGYMLEIEGWDAFIGMSFSYDDVTMARDKYVQNLTNSFILYLVLLVIVLGIFYQLTIKLILKNFKASKDEFESKKLEIEYISYHDHLTGLYNRRFFDENKEFICSGAFPKVLFMGDVNGLKLVNDAFGHANGDQLLIQTSRVLKDAIDDGYIFRWGGDEFLIISNNTKAIEAESIIQRIVSECNKIEIEGVELSISIGYAVIENEYFNVMEALDEAEEMMYSKKLLESKSTKAAVIENILDSLYDAYNFEKEHSENVNKFSMLIGEKLHMSEEALNKLSVASLLHDIGKIGMSDSIVTKPGPLDDNEWVEMKKHPEKGYRILSAYSELSEFSSLVLQHHERYDGKGYPHGIRGEQIPLFSRIIAIADAFDAMTSDRVYREKMSYNTAKAELLLNKGSQFDPFLVDVFIEALEENDG